MNGFVHIVCLDAPSPPDYGGAIDMYYKIKALAETGAKVILHYFDYKPNRSAGSLNDLCSEVYMYKRKPVWRSLPFRTPYIIGSRINQSLIQRLNNDSYPILLEGLHCAGIIPYLKNSKRVVLRMHNEEASYYKHLQKTTSSLFKKWYFNHESRLLHLYQQHLQKDSKLACLSQTDVEVFQGKYGFRQAVFIPCFISWQQVFITEGMGSFCLYHGNMQVSENEEAAIWLLQNVFRLLKVPFIIAGKGISKRVQDAAKEVMNVQLVHDPSISELEKLVSEAHINVLPSMNTTGVKLKLLNALINGRFCITNHNGIKGSQLDECVISREHPEDWIAEIELLMTVRFSTAMIEDRKKILALYDNEANARKLSALW